MHQLRLECSRYSTKGQVKRKKDANSLSFRSRSARGSMKYAPSMRCQVPAEKRPDINRQHTMLSQTSWRSLPLIRSLSRKKIERDSSSENSTDCLFCGFWKPRETSCTDNNEDIKDEDQDEYVTKPKETSCTDNNEDIKDGDQDEYVTNSAHEEEIGNQTVTFDEATEKI